MARCTVGKKCLLPFLCLTLFIIQLGLSLSYLPTIKLIQDIICKQSLGITFDDILPEEQCRDDAVQTELNLISMGNLISVTIGGALVALPLGILADNIGRVPVLGMSILGMFLSQAYSLCVVWQWRLIPLRAIWGVGAPILIGGGRSVAEAMIFTVISDTVSESTRALWFQCVAAAVIMSQVLAPIIAGRLLELSIWMPLWISLGCILIGGLALTLFTPETLPSKKFRMAKALLEQKEPTSTWHTVKSLFSTRRFVLLPAAVLAMPLASTTSNIILRVMPIQFSWPLSRSALLLSLSSLVSLVTLLLILPTAAYFCARVDATRRDRLFAKASATILMFGPMMLMMIRSEILVILGIVVCALGSGLPTLSRALLVAYMDGSHKAGSMFGVLAVGEILSFLACEVSMGALFQVGLSQDWLACPFLLALFLGIGIFWATWAAHMPKTKKTDLDGWPASQT